MIDVGNKQDLFENLMEILKQLVHSSSRPRKVMILTLVPTEWWINHASEFFEVPRSLIESAREGPHIDYAREKNVKYQIAPRDS